MARWKLALGRDYKSLAKEWIDPEDLIFSGLEFPSLFLKTYFKNNGREGDVWEEHRGILGQ